MPTYSTKDASEKWKRKTSHVRLRPILDKSVPLAKQNFLDAQTRWERLEVKVKGVLDRYGIIQDQRIPYHNYAKGMDRVQRVYPWMVDRVREHGILRARYEGLGLDSNVLQEIDKFVIYNAQLGP